MFGDEGADPFNIGRLVQCGQTRRLCQTGHAPRLADGAHLLEKGGVGTQTVSQPDARHAVQLGEGFQDEKIPGIQQRLGRFFGVVRQKVEETFVQYEKRPAFGAPAQDLFHKRKRRQLAGGVIGLAEEHHVDAFIDGRAECVRHRKIVRFLQKPALDRAIDRFQRGSIFRKGGCGDEGFLGLFGPDQPEDQVRRAVAAENVLGRNTFVLGKLGPQVPAERVRVAVGDGKRRPDGVGHPFRQTERTDVGRKIQRIMAEFGAVARPVSSMDEFHETVSFHKMTRTASPTASANRLSAHIMRLARRMSSGSMGRRGSPMVGFS